MVNGLDLFKEYFKDYSDNYVIIGGTACDIIIEEAGLVPRVTKDLTPIPVDDDLSSLSAILLSDDYYKYMIDHSTLKNGVHISNTEALICLKSKAFLEISERIAEGGAEDSKQLKKHKADVFRLAQTLTEEDMFDLPESIKYYLQKFTDIVRTDLPDKAIFKEMGSGHIGVENLFLQLIKNFKLKP